MPLPTREDCIRLERSKIERLASWRNQLNQRIQLNQPINILTKQKALLMQDFLLHIVRDKYVLAKQLLIQIQWIGVGFAVIRIDTSYPDAAGHSL